MALQKNPLGLWRTLAFCAPLLAAACVAEVAQELQSDPAPTGGLSAKSTDKLEKSVDRGTIGSGKGGKGTSPSRQDAFSCRSVCPRPGDPPVLTARWVSGQNTARRWTLSVYDFGLYQENGAATARFSINKPRLSSGEDKRSLTRIRTISSSDAFGGPLKLREAATHKVGGDGQYETVFILDGVIPHADYIVSLAPRNLRSFRTTSSSMTSEQDALIAYCHVNACRGQDYEAVERRLQARSGTPQQGRE
ncbi:MAG: hypothetical protein AAGH38_04565 [Pseudomonadota bacterium]